jgi:hypothetical protein
MAPHINRAALLAEPGLDVVFDYKIRDPSGNRYLQRCRTTLTSNPTKP